MWDGVAWDGMGCVCVHTSEVEGASRDLQQVSQSATSRGSSFGELKATASLQEAKPSLIVVFACLLKVFASRCLRRARWRQRTLLTVLLGEPSRVAKSGLRTL